MTLKQFIDKWNSLGIDFDGAAGFQCMDVYRMYCREVLKYPQSPALGLHGKASDVWTTYLKEWFTQVKNTPTGVPSPGDVVIWNTKMGLGYGHIAVVVKADVNSMDVFEQDGAVQGKARIKNRTYTNVLGWLVPKTKPATEPVTPKEEGMTVAEIVKKHNVKDLAELSEMIDRELAFLASERENNKTCERSKSQYEGQVGKLKPIKAELEKLSGVEVVIAEDVSTALLAYHKKLVLEVKKEEVIENKVTAPQASVSEGFKESLRLMISGAVGVGVAYAYTKYPFLGQLGPEQTVAVATVTSYIVKSLDKALHELGKKLDSGMLKGGLMRF